MRLERCVVHRPTLVQFSNRFPQAILRPAATPSRVRGEKVRRRRSAALRALDWAPASGPARCVGSGFDHTVRVPNEHSVRPALLHFFQLELATYGNVILHQVVDENNGINRVSHIGPDRNRAARLIPTREGGRNDKASSVPLSRRKRAPRWASVLAKRVTYCIGHISSSATPGLTYQLLMSPGRLYKSIKSPPRKSKATKAPPEKNPTLS